MPKGAELATDADFKKVKEELKWAKRRPPRPARAVGNILGGYMKGVVRPQRRKASPIVAAWNEIVPAGLGGCRILRVERGILTIELADASLLYHMETLKQELLTELRQRSKQIYVKDIRFVI